MLVYISMDTFFEQIFWDINNRYSIIIEDDDRVAYAYLLYNKQIIGDVWLYNRIPSPTTVNWNKTEMPFLNPVSFIKNIDFEIPQKTIKEYDFDWMGNENNDLLKVKIYIKQKLTAIIAPGSKPGWSINVKKDGPLAKVLR